MRSQQALPNRGARRAQSGLILNFLRRRSPASGRLGEQLDSRPVVITRAVQVQQCLSPIGTTGGLSA